jgi:hypothetical protein
MKATEIHAIVLMSADYRLETRLRPTGYGGLAEAPAEARQLTEQGDRIYNYSVHHVRSCPFGSDPPLVVVRLNGLLFLSF